MEVDQRSIFLMMTCPFEDAAKREVNTNVIFDVAERMKNPQSEYQPSMDGLDPRGFITKR